MPKFKILIAGAALLLAFAKPTVSQNHFSKNWFRYVSGNPYDPSNYTLVSLDPGCNGLDDLCAIYITINWTTFRPDFWSLQALGIESLNFSQAGYYQDGKIEMKASD